MQIIVIYIGMIKQNHFLTRIIEDYGKKGNINAIFSINSNKKALVFIHGYSGDSLKTWENFQNYLPLEEKSAGYDIFFYGYDGIKVDFYSSVEKLKLFLKKLTKDPHKIVNMFISPAFHRINSFNYEEILLIGHSLGSVISRQSLIDYTKDSLLEASLFKMIFYSPAHNGAKISELMKNISSHSAFINFFFNLIRFRSPLIDQLSPESETIIELKEDTIELTKNHLNTHLNAKYVFIAETENVVNNKRFCNDPNPILILDTNHTTVCKPNIKNMQPLEELVKIL